MARFTLHFRDHPLRLVPLGGKELVIGRDPACGIHIDSLALEARHARVSLADGVWTVSPWNEETPVFVNGERIRQPHRLREGDVVRVGKHSLHFSEEIAPAVVMHSPPSGSNVTALPLSRRAEGYLQFLSGSHVGRTIRLNRAMTRLGRSGEQTALIARRRDGYYLSLLEGDGSPELNGKAIGDRTCRLENGDRIRIGTLELQFFLEETSRATTTHDSPGERRFTRIAFPVEARLLDGDTQFPCRILDLSLKGALVELDEDRTLPPGRILILEIPLDEAATIRMETEAVRQDGKRHGLVCRDIDVDSVTHLRRLVALNSGEPELLERELAELG